MMKSGIASGSGTVNLRSYSVREVLVEKKRKELLTIGPPPLNSYLLFVGIKKLIRCIVN